MHSSVQLSRVSVPDIKSVMSYRQPGNSKTSSNISNSVAIKNQLLPSALSSGFADMKPIAVAHFIIKGLEKLKKGQKNKSVTIKLGTSIGDKKIPLVSTPKKLKNFETKGPASNFAQKFSVLKDDNNKHHGNNGNNGKRSNSRKTTKGTDSEQMQNRLSSQNSYEFKILEDHDSTDEWDGG
jgi:hypothetical protein